MFDRTFPSDETHDAPSDPGAPNGIGLFCRTETTRPDTGALLAVIPSSALWANSACRLTRSGPLSPLRPASGLTAE